MKDETKQSYNEPAFPRDNPAPDGWSQFGMTLRDYFAASVIGHLAASPMRQEMSVAQDASYAYKLADAMLAERAK